VSDIVVVICTYNHASLLDRALDTVEQQEVDPAVDWSVLVVDNNCTDNTREVVQSRIDSGSIPELSIIQESRQGLAYARHRAVRETCSELIAFVDDDCLLDRVWVQQAVEFFRERPRAGAVGGRVALLWETPPDEVLLRHEHSLAKQDHGDASRQMPATGVTWLVGASLVVRRSALLATEWLDRMILVGRRGSALTAGEDSEMVLRIRNLGYELWYNPAMRLQHFIPETRMSVDHLCRVRRGSGQSWPVLYTLGNRLQPNAAVRLHCLAASVKALGIGLGGAVYRDLLHGRRVSADRKIALSGSLGALEGSMRFLFRGF